MAKRYMFMDNTQPTASKQAKTADVHWGLCILCQEHTDEALQCPANSTRDDKGIGYKTLVNDLSQFQALGVTMPHKLELRTHDDGTGVESTLMEHSASWHKSCRAHYNKTKLQRAVRRQSGLVEPNLRLSEETRSQRKYDKCQEPETCLFCDLPAGKEGLHEASTFDIDHRVRQCAVELQDTKLLAKLSVGDMIAIEAKYHRTCLTKLYNTKRANSKKDDDDVGHLHGIAFAELVTYIEDVCSEEGVAFVFRLADLVKLYQDRLHQLGVSDIDKRIHSTRLKTRLLTAIPSLSAYTEGRDVLLTLDADVGGALKEACSHDSDAVHMAKAAEIVRRDIFTHSYSFRGSLNRNSEADVVPSSLLSLVNMILNGANIKHQTNLNHKCATIALSISQLMIFNSVKHSRSHTSQDARVRHNVERETPLSIYVAMKIHALTRSRNLVDSLFNHGLCVSYDRLLSITTDMANGFCERINMEQLVCPPAMRLDLFTTCAVDNIDHNPSSTTAEDSFHGTGISVMQHVTCSNNGRSRDNVEIHPSASTKKVGLLPSAYTDVPPASLTSKEFTAPPVENPVILLDLPKVKEATNDEKQWLNKVMDALLKGNADGSECLSWSAYHASMQKDIVPPPALTALLPLFMDNAHTVAMIKHSMDIICDVTKYLNPAQSPVFAVDQPLYALAKQIQWTWPAMYGEDKFVVMLGGLHVEMAMLKVLGLWLDGSGWTNILVQANIASSGTAESFIHASHVTKTRHAHQVTAASLHALLQEAYSEYSSTQDIAQAAEILNFDEWCSERAQQSAHFAYWLKTLELQVILLMFIRSLREGNFDLYVQSLIKIAPWMFALDRTNYARWLPIHIRDMLNLSKTHSLVFKEFDAGKFVVHKTRRKFSAISMDQAHEQLNALVKGSGGAVGLTSDPHALRRWMIAGPEVSRVITQFEDGMDETTDENGDNRLHHEQNASVQNKFLCQVQSLIDVLREVDNPFLEESPELLVLDTKDIMSESVAKSIGEAENLGQEQYATFTEDRLVQCKTPISAVIPKNKLPLLNTPAPRLPSKGKIQIASLKNDCSLFSRLYVASQTRDGDLENFFKHENQGSPPSLSLGGRMRSGNKANLLPCLEVDETTRRIPAPCVDANVLDGAAVVQMLAPKTAKTFQEYVDQIFIPYILKHLQKNNRLDLVWDTYMKDSLKACTREKRGTGTRRRVSGGALVPRNWKQFLRVDENKTELFGYISQQVIQHIMMKDLEKEVYATIGEDVLCSNPAADLDMIAPCTQEEADTRVILHASDAVSKGCRKVSIRTVDTDVIIIATAAYNTIQPEELWVAFGTGAAFRYIPIHEIARSLSPLTAAVLPMFHAFTGCDTVSAFCGRGKKTAWETWKVYPEVTQAFQELCYMTGNENISKESFALIERYVVLMYDRTSDILHVNEARMDLFTKKSRSIENIPPTQAALEQHMRRSSMQAQQWVHATVRKDPPLNPAEFGWTKTSSGWQPLWSTLPEAANSCYELIHCNCRKSCAGHCKCTKAALKCTALCACSGEC